MIETERPEHGVTLRQAALIAGFSSIVIAAAAPLAEFFVFPRLVIPGNIQETAENILANQGLFLAGTFAYLVVFTFDILVAWALYVLLAPVNRALSVLAAWFSLVYAAVAIIAALNLVTVFRMLTTPYYLTVFGSDQLHAQVHLLLSTFRYEFSMGLVLFGIHLGLVGYLVYRSTYIPRILGILLAIAGLGWVINALRPYLFPSAPLGFITITFVGELIFLLWLLVRGWRLRQP